MFRFFAISRCLDTLTKGWLYHFLRNKPLIIETKRSFVSILIALWLPWLSFLWILFPWPLFAATWGISNTNKYAWSENAGWINFRPDQGGVKIFPDHLEGFAWGENIGWIELGVGGTGPYANTNANNWGVNRDAGSVISNLSGYGWSETVGWIDFNAFGTTDNAVINATTGTFSGYVWSANVGWIHLSNTVPVLKYKISSNIIPIVSDITDRNSNEDESVSPIVINIGDTDPASLNVAVTVTSSNTALIPKENLILTGSGASRNLEIKPVANQYGSSIISVIATSGTPVEYTTTKTFNVVIAPVNDPPTATNLSAAEAFTEDAPAFKLTGIVITDIDSPTVTATLTLSNQAAGTLSTATSGGVTSQFDGTVWSANGALADVKTLLTGVTFTPAKNWDKNFTIATSVSDGVAPAVTGTKNVTVTPVNDAPTATNSSAAEAFAEDAPAFKLTGIVITDVDSPTVTATLTLSNKAAGSLSTATSGEVISQFDGTVWSASGALTDVNTLLAGVMFTPSANWDKNFTIATSISDGVAPAVTGSKNVTVTPVNDAPTATNLNAAEVFAEDAPAFKLTGIVISDLDSPTVTATLTLSNKAAGSLSTATAGGVASKFDGTVWSASGTLTDVNTLLAGVTLTPAKNWDQNFTIATSVSDGVAPALTGLKNFTVSSVNNPPTATNLNAAEAFTEDAPAFKLTGIVISDVDSPTVTATLTLSNKAAGSLSTATSGGVTSQFDGTVWSASGALADVNTLLAGVLFTPSANWDKNFTMATSISDGVASAVTGSKNVTVTPVNDAPTATNLNAAEVLTEDAPAFKLTGIVISDVDSPTVTATLTLSNKAAGSLSTTTSGGVTSKFDGTVWSASGAVTQVNTLLAGVLFTPSANWDKNFTMATSISDGVAPALTGNKNFTVTSVNDAPTATNGTLTTNEDTVYTGTLLAADTDTSTLTYSIVTQPAKGSVTLTNAATGAFSYTPTANVNGSDTFTFKANDGTLDSNVATINVMITPVNDAPVVTNGSFATDRDTVYNGTLSATDVDGASLTYSIVTPPAKGSVTITDAVTGAFSYTPNPNISGSDSFTFKATDGTLQSNTATMAITINAVNHAPVINGTPGKSVHVDTAYSFIPTASDVDPGTTLAFSIVNKPAWASFNTTTGQLSGTPTSISVGTTQGIVISVTDGVSPVSLPAFDLTVVQTLEFVKVIDGLFKTTQTVTLGCINAACVSIYYTLDGSEPTTQSLLYKEPIVISLQGTTQLRYFGVNAVGNRTSTITNNFIIDTIAPQVAITDPSDGTYVNGVNSIKGTASDGAGSGITTLKLQMTDGTDYVDNRAGVGLAWYPASLYTSDTLPWLAVADLSKIQDFSIWMLSPPNLKTGATYTLTVRATDKAGNVTTKTSRFTNTDKILVSGAILDGSGKPIPDVTVTFSDTSKWTSSIVSDTTGKYQGIVPNSGWSGKVTPTKPGYTFTPAELVITSIAAPRPNSNFTGTAVESEQDARAIIVAGGDLQDYLWPATKSVANYAYVVLRKKGIDKQNIRYLSMDVNQDLDNEKGSDINGLASSSAVQDAIINWAGGYVNNKKPLILYMVDHGLVGQFLVTKPRQGQADIITAAKLNEWLNTLQAKTGAKVILIMDACYSGSFVHELIPPKGLSRIVITSTDPTELAYFASDGDQSFSSFFWKYILMGRNLRDSFSASVQASRAASRNKQNPIMDADSDGVYNASKDTALVSTTYLGTPFFTAAVFPEITDSIPDSYMEEQGSGLTLWVQLSQDVSKTDRVWGVVVPPGTNKDSQDPITNLPILTLKFNSATMRYEATFDSTFSGFKGPGQYVISFYAQANDGERWISLPKSVTIQVGKDEFESDNTSSQASIIVINDTIPQRHNTHLANDADWIKFYALKDVTYAIEAINLGKNADMVLELFDADGVTALTKAVNDKGPGVDEKITFTPTKDGVYFVKASQFGNNIFGADTDYDLK
ncbi:MAG: tandem-95 repeat protein, partial [Magnetococcus sp. YQC-5]